MKKKSIILFLIIFFQYQFYASSQIIDTLPDVKLIDINGNVHNTYSDYLDQGKSLVIDFFTVSCSSCLLYAPTVQEVFQDFGCNEFDLKFLAVNYNEPDSLVYDFVDSTGIEFPAISGQEGKGHDLCLELNLYAFPTILVVDTTGYIAAKLYEPYELYDTLIHFGFIPRDCSGVYIKQNKISQDYAVFPNPGKHSIQISGESASEIFLYHTSGICMYSGNIESKSTTALNVKDWPRGVYIVIFKDNNNQQVRHKKLILH